MGLALRSAFATIIGSALFFYPVSSFAAKKQPRGKRSSTAPAKRPVSLPVKPLAPSDLVYKYLLGQVGGSGRDCPAITKSVTDWEKALQFFPRTIEGKNVLIVSGQFMAGDSQRLKSYLGSAAPISEIWLDSGGGNAAEGPLVGDVIRAARLKTRVAEGFACISSCSMAFLGGIIRQIDNNAVYGLHTFYNTSFLSQLGSIQTANDQDNTFHKNERNNAILAGKIQAYGQRMGISRDFFTKIMFVQRSRVVVSDRALSIMRQDMNQVFTNKQALDYITILAKKGIIYLEYDDEVADANRVIQFLMNPHTQIETDKMIGRMLQSYRCYPKNVLSSYNVINIVR